MLNVKYDNFQLLEINLFDYIDLKSTTFTDQLNPKYL